MKVFKNKWIRLLVCALISLVFRIFSEGNMLAWGIDNAVKFLIYYAAGDAFAQVLNNLSVNTKAFFTKKWPVLLTGISIVLAFLLYQFGIMYIPSLFNIQESYNLLFTLGCFYAFNGIYLTCLASIAMQNIPCMQSLGKNSLIICCMQRPIDKLFYSFTGLLGFSVNTSTQAFCLALAVIFMIIGVWLANGINKYFPYATGAKSFFEK